MAVAVWSISSGVVLPATPGPGMACVGVATGSIWWHFRWMK